MPGKTEYRICHCCEKWQEIKPLDQLGWSRRRSKTDRLYHDFFKYKPPIQAWKRVQRYCIICNKKHEFLIGPVTGNSYSHECDS